MSGTDKIFALLAGQPVLLRVLQPFIDCLGIDRIVVVLNNRNYDEGKELIVEQNGERRGGLHRGGDDRIGVVRVEAAGDCDLVVIQDGARPMVTVGLIEDGLETAKEQGSHCSGAGDGHDKNGG